MVIDLNTNFCPSEKFICCSFPSYPTIKKPQLEITTSQTLWECCHHVWAFQTVQTAIIEEGKFPSLLHFELQFLKLLIIKRWGQCGLYNNCGATSGAHAMTVASPTSSHVASWTPPLRRICTSSFPFKGILPEITCQRCTLPAFPLVVQHLAPTPALPSLFSSIPGSFCLRDIPTLCKQPDMYTEKEYINTVPLPIPP